MHSTARSTLLISLLTLLAAGCFQQNPTTDPSASIDNSTTADATDVANGTNTGDKAGCIAEGEFDTDKDYFPDKVHFDDAKLVSVDYHNSYKTITVTNPETNTKQTSVLVQCGAPTPELTGDLADASVVTVPATSIVTPSTTEISNFELLDILDHIGATGATEFLSSQIALDTFKANNVPAIANQSGELDAEKTISVKPDVVFMAGMESDAYKVIRDAKITVIDDNAWLESHPLGRAEWLKFFAALTNTESKANTEYERIKTSYEESKQALGAPDSKPKVLAGSTNEGQWFVPGKDSYVATFIADAGGDYVMADQAGTGSDAVDFEQVLAKGTDADIWINGQSSEPIWKTSADIIAADARLGGLKAVKEGKVFNPVKKIGPSGGNDYFERGVVEPDVILKDLMAAFHPDKFQDYESVYYQAVGK